MYVIVYLACRWLQVIRDWWNTPVVQKPSSLTRMSTRDHMNYRLDGFEHFLGHVPYRSNMWHKAWHSSFLPKPFVLPNCLSCQVISKALVYSVPVFLATSWKLRCGSLRSNMRSQVWACRMDENTLDLPLSSQKPTGTVALFLITTQCRLPKVFISPSYFSRSMNRY